MVRRVSVLALVAIMLFSVFAFGAGSCQIYDPRLTEMQRKIEELEEQARQQAERTKELEEQNRALRLWQHKADAVAALHNHLDTFDERGISEISWMRMQRYFEAGILSINEAESVKAVDEALKRAKENIDSVPYMDFEFRIVEEEIIVNYGEDFRVNVEFINQTGVTVVISITRFMQRIIYSCEHSHLLLVREFDIANDYRILENNEVLTNKDPWGDDSGIEIQNTLSRGKYFLEFGVTFVAVDILDELFVERRWQWTNTITLTVI